MNIYREITPLKETDVFVVLDSMSNGFDYPIHNHPEFELNLVAGMSGTRIVGDSTERYTDTDLVLLGPYLYHKWDGDEHLQRSGRPYRVITIQFGMDLFGGHFGQKERFLNIRQLLQDSGRGCLARSGRQLRILKREKLATPAEIPRATRLGSRICAAIRWNERCHSERRMTHGR